MSNRFLRVYKNEIRKITVSKFFIVFMSILLITIVIATGFFYISLDSEPYYSTYGVSAYKNSNELTSNFQDNEDYIKELSDQLHITSNQRRRELIMDEIKIKERLSLVYKHLLKHKEITYSKYYDFGALTNSGFSDALSFFGFVSAFTASL